MSFYEKLKTNIQMYLDPFNHWEINQPLSQTMIDEIMRADIKDPNKEGLAYDGTRALDAGSGEFRKGIKLVVK